MANHLQDRVTDPADLEVIGTKPLKPKRVATQQDYRRLLAEIKALREVEHIADCVVSFGELSTKGYWFEVLPNTIKELKEALRVVELVRQGNHTAGNQ